MFFLGHRKHHASSVELVLKNLSSNMVISQYRVVINDWLRTCTSTSPPQAMIDKLAIILPDGLFSIPTDSYEAVLSE